jgi:hypothetical protein
VASKGAYGYCQNKECGKSQEASLEAKSTLKNRKRDNLNQACPLPHFKNGGIKTGYGGPGAGWLRVNVVYSTAARRPLGAA